MTKEEELRQLLQEAVDAAVPPAEVTGRYAGLTQCNFCYSTGSFDHALQHKSDCLVTRAKAALKSGGDDD